MTAAGKIETKEVTITIEEPPAPIVSCPLNLSGFPLTLKAGESDSKVVVSPPNNEKEAITSIEIQCSGEKLSLEYKPDFVTLDPLTGNMVIKPGKDVKAGDYTFKINKETAAGEIETKEVTITIPNAQCKLITKHFPVTMKIGEEKAMSLIKEDNSEYDLGECDGSFEIDSVGPQASFFEIDQATGKLTMKPGNNLSQTGKFKVGIKRTTADGAPIIEYVEITVTPAKCELDTSAFPMEMMTGEKKNPFFVDEEISTKIATVCPKEEWELDTQS